jgi:UDPglucose 6-dehydrogenase
VTHDLSAFKQQAKVIVTNRVTDDLKVVASKVFASHLFGVD